MEEKDEENPRDGINFISTRYYHDFSTYPASYQIYFLLCYLYS